MATLQKNDTNSSENQLFRFLNIMDSSAFVVVLLLLIVVPNVVVLGTILTRKTLHRPSHILLGSVSIDSLLTSGVMILAQFGYNVHDCTALQQSIVLLLGVPSDMLLSSALLLAFDRFLALRNPFQYETLVTVQRCLILLVIRVIFHFISHLVVQFATYGMVSCKLEFTLNQSLVSWIFIAIGGVGIFYFHCYSLCVARHHARAIAIGNNLPALQVHFKALRTAGVMIAASWLTLLPVSISGMGLSICTHLNSNLMEMTRICVGFGIAFSIFRHGIVLKSIISPFLYTYASSELRDELRKIFNSLKKKSCNRSVVG
ncbi:adrenocorticotropic hormone receptor-like [Limulus polyphemus]|uniref:Adrenocorticotropic hormone receptor-like n=1 Tax=Limulus polyphemus TaxID=6850 RepID=A0ABM1TR78_LIMPO|nr:adrenocorticotropic hormone receptor-like [Limulus polyphemus]